MLKCFQYIMAGRQVLWSFIATCYSCGHLTSCKDMTILAHPQVREEEFASEAAERVTARKAYMLHASASKFAGIQSSRIKTMRQLIEARK